MLNSGSIKNCPTVAQCGPPPAPAPTLSIRYQLTFFLVISVTDNRLQSAETCLAFAVGAFWRRCVGGCRRSGCVVKGEVEKTKQKWVAQKCEIGFLSFFVCMCVLGGGRGLC